MLPVLMFPQFDPVIVQFGPIAIRWYALAYIASLLIGWRMVRHLVQRSPAVATPLQVDDFLTWATLGVVFGGRFGYVLFYQPGRFFAHPWEIFAVWHGGMSFHGGMLGVAIAVAWFCRRNAIPILGFADRVAVVAPIGLGLGRVANFINGELWGRAAPDWLPWAMIFPPGGPVDPYTCGTCAPVAKLGEVCGSANCESNAICLNNDPTHQYPTNICLAVTEGEIDASCDGLVKVCKPGLYCDEDTSRCVELGSVGAPCGECKPPLICAGSPPTCRDPLPEGATCDPNAPFDCAPGLFCFATTGECTAVSWARPGERCSEVQWCLVGFCITTEYIGGIASGTCPALIPDAAPCDVPDPDATCDVFAECFQGTCQLPGGLVCN